MTNYRSIKDGVEREMTLHEVAEELGTSYEVIRTTEIKAIRKLKTALFEKYGNKITLHDILPALSGKGDYDEQMSCL